MGCSLRATVGRVTVGRCTGRIVLPRVDDVDGTALTTGVLGRTTRLKPGDVTVLVVFLAGAVTCGVRGEIVTEGRARLGAETAGGLTEGVLGLYIRDLDVGLVDTVGRLGCALLPPVLKLELGADRLMLVLELGRDVEGRLLVGRDEGRLDDLELPDDGLLLEEELGRVEGALDRELRLCPLIEVERLGERDMDLPASVRLVCAIATEPIDMIPAKTTAVTRFAFITPTSRRGLTKLTRMTANDIRTPCLTVPSVYYSIPYIPPVYSLFLNLNPRATAGFRLGVRVWGNGLYSERALETQAGCEM